MWPTRLNLEGKNEEEIQMMMMTWEKNTMMNKYRSKRYGQELFDGTIVNWSKKKRLEKRRKKFFSNYQKWKEEWKDDD